MQQFTQAAVSSMSQPQNRGNGGGGGGSGFGNFMSDIAGMASSSKPAAAAYSHQPQYNPNQQMNMPPMPMPTVPQRAPPPPIQTQGDRAPPPPRRPGDLTNVRPDVLMGRGGVSQTIQQSLRPEMKGPSDISTLLSGLKTKSVSVDVNKNQTQSSNGGGSTISASDLNEMKNDNIPNKSKRKQKSDRTSISLDI
jgi:hypothetical protein